MRHLQRILRVQHPNLYKWISKRFFYEQTKSGSVEFEERKKSSFTKKELIKKNAKVVKDDLNIILNRIKESTIYAFKSDVGFVPFDNNQLIKIWDFDQRNNDKLSSYYLEYKIDKMNDMNNWNTTCDADFDIGFSKSSWTVSPSGYGLFSGYLDNTLPKDGKVVNTGYAYLYSNEHRQPFNIPNYSESIFENFTHVVMRVRGDGRHYYIIFDTSSYEDISWFDRYQFPLYTFGGPYWQYVKIPFTRFYFHYQGYIQDQQYEFQPFRIKRIGFLVHNSDFSGPFSLEIDYIGFIKDEHNDKSEYETYYHESGKLITF